MDPNATLQKIRRLVRETDELHGGPEAYELALELGEEIEALDRWLTHGGSLPTAWTSNP